MCRLKRLLFSQHIRILLLSALLIGVCRASSSLEHSSGSESSEKLSSLDDTSAEEYWKEGSNASSHSDASGNDEDRSFGSLTREVADEIEASRTMVDGDALETQQVITTNDDSVSKPTPLGGASSEDYSKSGLLKRVTDEDEFVGHNKLIFKQPEYKDFEEFRDPEDMGYDMLEPEEVTSHRKPKSSGREKDEKLRDLDDELRSLGEDAGDKDGVKAGYVVDEKDEMSKSEPSDLFESLEFEKGPEHDRTGLKKIENDLSAPTLEFDGIDPLFSPNPAGIEEGVSKVTKPKTKTVTNRPSRVHQKPDVFFINDRTGMAMPGIKPDLTKRDNDPKPKPFEFNKPLGKIPAVRKEENKTESLDDDESHYPDYESAGKQVIDHNAFPTKLKKAEEWIKKAYKVMDSETLEVALLRHYVMGVTHYFDSTRVEHPKKCACKKHLPKKFQNVLFKEESVKTTTTLPPTLPQSSPGLVNVYPASPPAPQAPVVAEPLPQKIGLPVTIVSPVIKQDEPAPSPKSLGLLYYMPFFGHLSAVAAYFLLGFLVVSTVGMTGLFVNMRMRGIEEVCVKKAAAAEAARKRRRQSVMRVDV